MPDRTIPGRTWSLVKETLGIVAFPFGYAVLYVYDWWAVFSRRSTTLKLALGLVRAVGPVGLWLIGLLAYVRHLALHHRVFVLLLVLLVAPFIVRSIQLLRRGRA